MNGIQFEEGKYGQKAVITSSWSAETERVLKARSFAELELNDGKGWRGTDLSFLKRFPDLLAFRLIDLKIPSDEQVHSLHELRALTLISYCESELRFSEFPKLEECDLQWRVKAQSLFSCHTLRELFVDECKEKDADKFANLTNLESLAIMNAPIENIHGLGKLTKLKSLRIGNLKLLKSLGGIECLTNLEELDINTCPQIATIDEIQSLSRLRKLNINNCGKIESFKALETLKQLEVVVFYESTNVLDGDLSPLTRLPKLHRVSFQNRRHYSQRREDFCASIQ